MKVYLRKLFKHDITHEVSVSKNIISLFFEGQEKSLFFVNKGQENGRKYEVMINSVTDPRFGGEFKAIYKSQNVKEGDVLAIRKIGDLYELSVILEQSAVYEKVSRVFKGNERHAIVDEKLIEE